MSHFSPHFSPRPFVLALPFVLSLAALAQDQPQPPPQQSSPAPIVRQYAPAQQQYAATQRHAMPPISVTSPSPGIWVRSAPGSDVKTVATTADSVELSVSKGLANVTIRQPKESEQILVDLPGGQVALFKDGLYTFNATTSTFRVLEGEAAAYPASDAKAKALTVKEDHAVVFGDGNLHSGSLKSVEFAPFQAQADILPAGRIGRGEPGYRPNGYYDDPAYAYGPGWGPYGDGYYGYPYYAYGYPYGWGWGYPYFGVGFGFGGYWGGGFRGGFRR